MARRAPGPCHSCCSSSVIFRQQNGKKGEGPDGCCRSPQMDVQHEQGVKPGMRMGWGRWADLPAARARWSNTFPPDTDIPYSHAHLAWHPERHKRQSIRAHPTRTLLADSAPSTVPNQPHGTLLLLGTTPSQPPPGKPTLCSCQEAPEGGAADAERGTSGWGSHQAVDAPHCTGPPLLLRPH